MSDIPGQGIRPLNENEFELFPEFTSGPLDVYRKQASFCWKKMRMLIEGEVLLKFKMKVWKTLEADPLFQRSPQALTTDELRRINFARLNRLKDYDFLNPEELMEDPRKWVIMVDTLNHYSADTMLKYCLPFYFFLNSLHGMGTRKHDKYVEMVDKREIWGAFCMTEISHGTNNKSVRTTATFDPASQEFILHTPDFEAAKCWAGGLGQTCTHASIFAQLVTPDGQSKGLHAFLTPIRDPKTMLPYSGIIVGDMGEKVGLNAVDNGFLMLNNYRIPKDFLLDKQGSVTPEGHYQTPYKDPRKRFGASMGPLMAGRMGITSHSTRNIINAIVIATRYSAVRRQFGPKDGDEIPVIEYQLQQWRLIPYLSAAYCLSALAGLGIDEYIKIRLGQLSGVDRETQQNIGVEMHVIMSSAKPLASWIAQHGIQVCREACGGHGYLKAAGFGDLRDNNDANCTYEGVNDVILQQTSNWLLGLWNDKQRLGGKLTVPFKSPLGSVQFLHDIERVTNAKFTARTVEELINPAVIFEMYHWLICYLIEATEQRYKNNLKLGKDPFTAKNDAQVFYARSLSLAFIEHFTMQCFWRKIAADDVDPQLKPVLVRVCSLFGLWRLEQYTGEFYAGGFANGPALSQLIKDAILRLCTEIKPDAVALADAIAPPDFILNSPLGHSNGEVYKNLEATFYQTPGVFSRPSWWKEMLPKQTISAKL